MSEQISIQLYSLRALEPLEARLALVAGLGYRFVEPSGALIAEPERLKAGLAAHGLSAPSAHVGMPALRDGASAAARLCRDLGVQTIFAPAPPPDERDRDLRGWRRFARELREIGRAVTGEGIAFGWHNHHFEFVARDGLMPMQVILDEAPEILWQMDIAWLIRAGEDPLVWLARYAGRVVSCHIKDMAAPGAAADEDGWADVGYGRLDWSTLLPAIRAAGIRLYVLEHDRPADPARFAGRSLATLSDWMQG
jgi:sugar phosphate isomerase/epimerase